MLDKAVHRGSSRGYLWIDFPDRPTYEAYCKYEETHRRETAEMMEVFQQVMGGLAKGRFLVRGYIGNSLR